VVIHDKKVVGHIGVTTTGSAAMLTLPKEGLNLQQ